MKWISVKDKLPNLGDNVLIWKPSWKELVCATGWRVEDLIFRCGTNEPFIEGITHWQPLPEPPKLRFKAYAGHFGAYSIHLGSERLELGNVWSTDEIISWLNDLIEKGTLTVEN